MNSPRVIPAPNMPYATGPTQAQHAPVFAPQYLPSGPQAHQPEYPRYDAAQAYLPPQAQQYQQQAYGPGQAMAAPYQHPVRSPYAGSSPHTPVAAKPLTLTQYNHELETLMKDINGSMNPFQRNAARVVNVVGTIAAMGGAVTAGVMGMTALATAATGIGIPVAAAAAVAGVTVFVAGVGVTLVTSALLRSLLRQNVSKNPALAPRLNAARDLRAALMAKKDLSKAEKLLLKNVSRVLGKVEGVAANFKAQAKTSGKTGIGVALSAVIIGALALAGQGAAQSEGAFYFGGGPLSNLGSPSGGFASSGLNNTQGDINLHGADHLLAGLAG